MMMRSETNKIIEELFKSLRQRYKKQTRRINGRKGIYF